MSKLLRIFWVGAIVSLLACSGSEVAENDTDLITDESVDLAQAAEAIDLGSKVITRRDSNLACLAGDAPVEPVVLHRIFENLTLSKPVHMAQAPGADQAPYYIAEKNGRLLVVPASDDASDVDVTVALQLDVLTRGESGITGFAFHPDFVSNGKIYLSYGIEVSPDSFVHRLSSFTRLDNTDNFSNEEILISMPKDNAEHFGGAIAFGPDRHLYFSVGDDGDNLDGDDHPLLAQVPTSFYGAILRIDIDNPKATKPYGIPTDNPDFTGNGPNEIWAQGFRNPWRISFDRMAPHALWGSDVGAREKEEINRIEGGGNYGWPHCEGRCDPTDPSFINPEYSYSNIGGAASIGGFVYRGQSIPELYGKYLFADYVSQEIYTLDPELLPNEPLYVQQLTSTPFSISGFAEDQAGELYVLGFSNGAIYRFGRNEDADRHAPL